MMHRLNRRVGVGHQPRVDRAPLAALFPHACPCKHGLPLHSKPRPRFGALLAFGLGKASQRDQAAVFGTGLDVPPHQAGQVGDVIHRLRLDRKAGLVALLRERKAPRHCLHHAPAVRLAHHHAGGAGIHVTLRDIEAVGIRALKASAMAMALTLTV